MLNHYLLLAALVLLFCVALNHISLRTGIPVLLAFIGLGMMFGSDGVVKIAFDNYELSETICSFALIYIMFSGGFETNWSRARSVSGQAILLSSAGVVLTALALCLFVHSFLKLPWNVSFLMGAVVSSTDAAAVFSLLKSKKLSLKHNTASLLEVESGSNDPSAYLLTLIGIAMCAGGQSVLQFTMLIVKQIGLGLLLGVLIARISIYVVQHYDIRDGSFDFIFVVAVASMTYSLSTLFGGNGYLAVYLCGIILGNVSFRGKSDVIRSLEGLSNIMQILIFFLLGLLVHPSRLIGVFGMTVAIALFLTLVARPLAVFLLMLPFRMPWRQQLLISFAGLRGASAIVFSIMAITRVSGYSFIFDATFAVVLLSILVQGGLLAPVSAALDMIDFEGDVMKTFNDYTAEVPVEFIRCPIPKGYVWENRSLAQITLPPKTLAVLLKRDGQEDIVPNGSTVLHEGDELVLTAVTSRDKTDIRLFELVVEKDSEQLNRQIKDLRLKAGQLVILIKRGNAVLIPHGNDVIREHDVLVMNDVKQKESR